jgi:hypothetical protein
VPAARITVAGNDTTVLDSVDDDDFAVIVDLVDHSVVAAPCRVQAGQFADQGLADPSRVLGDGSKHCLDGRVADLAGKLVEVPQPFWGDLDLEHEAGPYT